MYGVIHRVRDMKRKKQRFSISRYLATMVPGSLAVSFQEGEAIFYQRDTEDALYYIRRGEVRLTAVSKAGREAVIGLSGQVTSLAKDAWSVNASMWLPPLP